jgi:uncharacterized membrane protein
MYELYLSLHLVCAVLWVGGGVSVHVLARWTAKTGDPEALLQFNRNALKLSARFYAPLAIVLLLAGIQLVREVGYEFSDLWISLALLAWVLSLALGVVFYPFESRRIEAAVADGGPSAPAVRKGINRVLVVNALEVTILLLVVVDMAVKPGA